MYPCSVRYNTNDIEFLELAHVPAEAKVNCVKLLGVQHPNSSLELLLVRKSLNCYSHNMAGKPPDEPWIRFESGYGRFWMCFWRNETNAGESKEYRRARRDEGTQKSEQQQHKNNLQKRDQRKRNDDVLTWVGSHTKHCDS